MNDARRDKPLADIRVLAIEQMQALPYATQLLSRFGADVVKIEPPATRPAVEIAPTLFAASSAAAGRVMSPMTSSSPQISSSAPTA